jgi:hypothetical protein
MLKAMDWRAEGGMSNIFFIDDINTSAKRDVSKGINEHRLWPREEWNHKALLIIPVALT